MMQNLKMQFYKLADEPECEHPLALFQHCDNAVVHQMYLLAHLMKYAPNNLDRRSKLIKQLKEAQNNLVNVLMHIVEILPCGKISRNYQTKYPDDVQLELLGGPIWFGAECLAAGSHIANHAMESTEIRPYAITLSKVISELRSKLREEGTQHTDLHFSYQTRELLQRFDKAWVDFEFRYVSVMSNVRTETQLFHQQEIAVLFSEATQRALKMGYFSEDMLEMMDPSVMFAIPRMAIICGLVVYPEGPLNPQRPYRDIPVCFSDYNAHLTHIKEQLGNLSEDHLTLLEKALCSSDGIKSLLRRAPSVDSFLEFIDQEHEGSLPCPSNNRDTFTSFSSLEDDCSSTYSQSPSSSVCGSSRSSSSLSQVSSSEDISAEDETLLQQLFVLISEVADQLQSNHPHDFRSILKMVFEIFVADQDGVEETLKKSPSRSNRFDEEFDTEQFLERFNLSLTSLELPVFPQRARWVSDEDAPDCQCCDEQFTMFRRRHHCRACGQVVCSQCSPHNLPLKESKEGQLGKPVRVCVHCYISQLKTATNSLIARH